MAVKKIGTKQSKKIKKFPHKEVEEKWIKKWEESGIYKTNDDSKKKKYYFLDMYPYPSGAGLHMGHMENYTASDIGSRYRRMKGYEVLHPMGWDSFGLPTENYAIKTGQSPKKHTKHATETFRSQQMSLGCSYDWSREFGTHEPHYYKWTQWLFLFLFENGLAYRKKAPVNWCPKCQTVLANEQVIDGACERCNTEVVQKDIPQWFFKVTDYADRLLDDLEDLDWPESTKEGQRNWIGKSKGAAVKFQIQGEYSSFLLSSQNPSKLKRVRKLLEAAGIDLEVKTAQDLNLEPVEVEEDRGTLLENARKKASAYAGKVDIPILALDTGFFIDGEEIDFVQVKRNALKGKDESSMSQRETAECMIEYYRSIAKRKGGEVKAHWRSAWVLLLPDGSELTEESTREVVLTDKVVGEVDEHFPLRSMYICKDTGKYIAEQTEEEELIELSPITEALKRMFASEIEVFTTRPDTIFGATYLVLAPEHPLVDKLTTSKNKENVEKYKKEASKKTELERVAERKSKDGVFTGAYAVNPANGEEIPIWIADYVMMSYGTGALMGVPAHDERDFAFAEAHDLDIVEVIEPPKDAEYDEVYAGKGKMVNSGKYDGMESGKFADKIVEDLGDAAEKKTEYKIRDWLISRQRYWGAPIPIIHCEKCGPVGVPTEDLPVLLPDDIDDYRPKGKPPLANSPSFSAPVKCPKCGNENASREYDTMDTFVDSSWYYYRFTDPQNDEEFASEERVKMWMPVDFYMGGAEHTVGHLIYSRFVTKVLYDEGVIGFKEPFTKLRHQGMVLAEDGRKMSKRWGNVVNPDDVVKEVGADSARMYTMFMGPLEDSKAWSTEGLHGVRRFVDRLWRAKRFLSGEKPSKEEEAGIHRLIKRTGENIEKIKFNVCVSDFMIFVNEIYGRESVSKETWRKFLLVLAPFAPFIAEELWAELGESYSIHEQSWPEYDEKLIKRETVTIAVQVNGKVRGEIEISPEAEEKEVLAEAFKVENVKKHAKTKENVKKVIYVPGKIINLTI